jgi:hypothetical protein
MIMAVPVAIRRNATKMSGTASIPVKASGGLGFELGGWVLAGCELAGFELGGCGLLGTGPPILAPPDAATVVLAAALRLAELGSGWSE